LFESKHPLAIYEKACGRFEENVQEGTWEGKAAEAAASIAAGASDPSDYAIGYRKGTFRKGRAQL
jgi:hypothetical protein